MSFGGSIGGLHHLLIQQFASGAHGSQMDEIFGSLLYQQAFDATLATDDCSNGMFASDLRVDPTHMDNDDNDGDGDFFPELQRQRPRDFREDDARPETSRGEKENVPWHPYETFTWVSWRPSHRLSGSSSHVGFGVDDCIDSLAF